MMMQKWSEQAYKYDLYVTVTSTVEQFAHEQMMVVIVEDCRNRKNRKVAE